MSSQLFKLKRLFTIRYPDDCSSQQTSLTEENTSKPSSLLRIESKRKRVYSSKGTIRGFLFWFYWPCAELESRVRKIVEQWKEDQSAWLSLAEEKVSFGTCLTGWWSAREDELHSASLYLVGRIGCVFWSGLRPSCRGGSCLVGYSFAAGAD